MSNLKEYSRVVTQPEQDVLNITFVGKKYILPLRFMFCTYLYSVFLSETLDLRVTGRWLTYLSGRYYDLISGDDYYSEQEIRAAFASPIQVHFATGVKPWSSFACYRKLTWLKHLFFTGFMVEHLIKNESRNVVSFVRNTVAVRSRTQWLIQKASRTVEYFFPSHH